MAQGVAMGNAQKTTTQAIMEGVTEGIRTGQDIYGRYQDSELKQQQIDQAPLELQIKQQQLENAKAVNELNAMKLRIQTANEADELKVAQAEAKAKLDIVEGKDKLSKAMTSDNPQDKLDVLNDPQAHAAMLADAKLAEAIAGELKGAKDLNGNPLLTPEQADAFDERVRYGKKREEEAQLAEANAKLKAKMTADLDATAAKMGEGNIGYIGGSHKLTPNQWADDVKIFPAGVKNFNMKTGILDPNAPDNDITGPNMANIGKFDVAVRQPDGSYKKANVLLSDIEADTVTKFQTAVKASPLYAMNKQNQPAPEIAQPSKPENRFDAANAVEATPVTQPDVTIGDIPYKPASVPPRGMQSTDSQSRQMYDRLVTKAASDPEVAKRMVDKGYLPGAGDTSSSVQPRVATVPGINGRPIRDLSSGINGKPIRDASVPTVLNTVADAKAVVAKLPPAVQKYVSPETLHRVEQEPLLKGKSPLIKAVVAQESAGKRDAISPTGAKGLMQLTKAAAKDVKADRDDPAQNVKGGIDYLENILDNYNSKYKGNEENNEILALMAYNGGPGLMNKAIDHAIDMTGSTDWKEVADAIEYLQEKGYYSEFLTPAKVKETVSYPAKVLAYKKAFSSLDYAG
jgi:hypothetical protein